MHHVEIPQKLSLTVHAHPEAQRRQVIQRRVPPQAQRRRQQTDHAALGRLAIRSAHIEPRIHAPGLHRPCEAQKQRTHA